MSEKMRFKNQFSFLTDEFKNFLETTGLKKKLEANPILRKIRQRFSASDEPEGRSSSQIKVINQILIAVIAAAVLFLLGDILWPRPTDPESKEASPQDTSRPMVWSFQDTPRELAYYQSSVQKRNAFVKFSELPIQQAGEAGVAQSAATAAALEEALKNFKLVGLLWESEPVAMIEDLSAQRTFFLRKDQEIKNVRVLEILKDRVRVSYQGAQGELELL